MHVPCNPHFIFSLRANAQPQQVDTPMSFICLRRTFRPVSIRRKSKSNETDIKRARNAVIVSKIAECPILSAVMTGEFIYLNVGISDGVLTNSSVYIVQRKSHRTKIVSLSYMKCGMVGHDHSAGWETGVWAMSGEINKHHAWKDTPKDVPWQVRLYAAHHHP